MAIKYEPLTSSHSQLLQNFTCSEPTFAAYLQNQALTDSARKLNTTILAIDGGVLVGYFSYCSSSMSASQMSAKDKRSLPEYPIPSILLTRLAVDKSAEGRGIGSDILIEFLSVVAKLNVDPYAPAARMVYLDLYKPELSAFYERLSFKKTRDGKQMYKAVKTIAALIANSKQSSP